MAAYIRSFDALRLTDVPRVGGKTASLDELGVDRDSEVVAFDFDERDPGVQQMLRQAEPRQDPAGGRRRGSPRRRPGSRPRELSSRLTSPAQRGR